MDQISVENDKFDSDDEIVKEQFVSQKNYRPTPYEAAIWEAVGERIKEKNFISMNLEVLRDESATGDPMFEDFDARSQLHHGESFNTPGGDRSSIEIEEELTASLTTSMDEEVLQQLLAEKFEEGRAQGVLEGEMAVKESVAEHYQELSRRMTEITGGIEKQIATHVEEIERRAFELSLRVAKMLIQTTVEAKPEYIIDVIGQALKSLGVGKPKTIRVSQQDFEFLDIIGLPPEISELELGVKYLADDSIQSGCVIETDFGEVNLELEAMWEKIKDKLYKMV